MANIAYIHIPFGIVAADPTTRQQGNSTVTTFKIYVQTTKKSQDPKHPYASDLYTVSVWGKDGENVMKNVKKSSKVSVHGAFKVGNPWKDRNGADHIDLLVDAAPMVIGGVQVLDGQRQAYANNNNNNQTEYSEESPF